MWKFVLAVLATWRVTHLLAKEDGPGEVIYRFRFWLGQSSAGKLMDCFSCMSLWVAAPVALFVSLRVAEYFVSWLAISGAACLIEGLMQERVAGSQGDLNHVLWPESRTIDRPSGVESDNNSELQEKHSD
jgi:Protein of unknown function (DUF1360)